MNDLHSIIADHKNRRKSERGESTKKSKADSVPTLSEIPDLFFDNILIEYKLNRIEIMVLMYLYRHVWCRPNLYKAHGISQLLSHSEMGKKLGLEIKQIYFSLRKLEEYGFIYTVRSGQYFVRKYFSKEYDEKYHQTYDNFEV